MRKCFNCGNINDLKLVMMESYICNNCEKVTEESHIKIEEENELLRQENEKLKICVEGYRSNWIKASNKLIESRTNCKRVD